MPPMLFFSLLLFQIEKALLFGYFLLAALLLTLGFHHLTLQLQRLLRFCTDTGMLQLLCCVARPTFWIVSLMPDFNLNSRTELQFIVVFEDKCPYFAVLRLCTESDFAHGQFPVFHPFKYAYPERFFKEYSKLRFVHINPSLCVWDKERTTRRGRLLTSQYGETAGLP